MVACSVSGVVSRVVASSRGLGLSLVAAAAGAFALLSQSVTPAQAGGEHVYLFRGFANVFSLGMDQMADQLKRRGVNATVHNHMEWPVVAEQAAKNYKAGKETRIVLVGHSAGGPAVVSTVERLGELGVPVARAIVMDGGSLTVSGGRAQITNFYVGNGVLGFPMQRSGKFVGSIANVDVTKLGGDAGQSNHMTIDKSKVVQQRALALIR